MVSNFRELLIELVPLCHLVIAGSMGSVAYLVVRAEMAVQQVEEVPPTVLPQPTGPQPIPEQAKGRPGTLRVAGDANFLIDGDKLVFNLPFEWRDVMKAHKDKPGAVAEFHLEDETLTVTLGYGEQPQPQQ